MLVEKVKRNYVLRKLAIKFLNIISYLNEIIPKDSNRILLYDSDREYLADNTEALYSYLINNNYDKKYKIICYISREKKNSSYEKNIQKRS